MKKPLLAFAPHSVLALVAGTALSAVFACSAGGGNSGPGLSGSGATGSGATGSGATGGIIDPGSGAGPSTGGTISVPDAGNDPDGGRETRCDDAGNCSCINVAVVGRLPTYGAGGADTTIAFQTYLNTKSSAAVEVLTTKPALTAEWLANYDILILQALEDKEGGPYWTFSAEELATFEAWIKAGGGVITLTGYGGQGAEVTPTNQLLAFTGLSYNMDDILFTCPAAENGCCYCSGAAVPMAGWNAAHPISANVTYVGAFHGRSVNAPADALIVAQEGATVYGATKQVENGRVFMFNDEWVTYTSQWSGQGTECSTITDMNHQCYGKAPETYFQVAQFWYNSLVWTSGDRECFTIDDPVIVK